MNITIKCIVLVGVASSAGGLEQISSSRARSIGDEFVRKAGLNEQAFSRAFFDSRSKLWHLSYKGGREEWAVRIAPDGEVFSAESSRLYPLQRSGAKGASASGKLVAASKALAIVKGLAGSREFYGGTSGSRLITFKYGIKHAGIPVHGYGCTLVFDSHGYLLEYGGKWNIPSARAVPPRVRPWAEIVAQNALPPARDNELKWFDLGDGVLTLAWRVKFAKSEVIYDAITGKKLVENYLR